ILRAKFRRILRQNMHCKTWQAQNLRQFIKRFWRAVQHEHIA
ncbi:MAG: hypothetical protein FD128_1574, partial [Hyphomonadaceae bacterium]